MNRVDFTKTGGIERSQDLWDYLQQSYTSLFSGLAALIGNNVIVAGVADLGANYGNGWVVINGELLPFEGGLKAAQIVVVQNITQEAYDDGNSKDAYYTRYAQCAGSGGTLVSSFVRLSNMTQFATTSQLTTAINNLVNGAPGTLDTLKELADALADNPNFATTITNLISTEATNRANADSAEATARANADTAEAMARGNADTAEATARTNADALLAPKAQGGWTNITLAAGAIAAGRTPQYRVDSFGQVHLRGELSSSSGGAMATGLPAPSQQWDVAAIDTGYAGQGLTISATGNLTGAISRGYYLDSVKYWLT